MKGEFGGPFSILDGFWEVMGGQNGRQTQVFGRFLAMLFSSAVRHRVWVIFGGSQPQNIGFRYRGVLIPIKSAFSKNHKKHPIWASFWEAKAMKNR